MSPVPSVLQEIKTYLKERHIVVTSEWIEACVDFLKEEFNTISLPLPRLKNLVYDQWLAADLCEIGASALPHELVNSEKLTLKGCFALQVNGLKDVGKPAYAQLKELEGSSNTDIEVSAAPKAYVPEWESKSTRMLILSLTDGKILVEGMEYKPITMLSPNLPPGFKVLVKGPIDCRLGMLILTSEKIEILGGRVDSFQNMYSREGILRKALNLPSRNDENSLQSAEGSVHPNHNGSPHTTHIPNSDENVTESVSSNNSRQNRVDSRNITSIRSTMDVIDNFDSDDDFVHSIDYDALDEIEKANTQGSNSGNQNAQVEDMICDDQEFLNSAGPFPEDEGDIQIIDNDAEVQNSSKSEDKLFKVPCSKLSDVDQSRKDEFTVTIKGYVVNVLSRLECKVNKGWHLTAKVSDGTLSIDADFHDKVLEELIGISAQDMMVMQIESRENPKLKSKIIEAVGSCKAKLQELNCYLEIKFSPGERPSVIRCIDHSKS